MPLDEECELCAQPILRGRLLYIDNDGVEECIVCKECAEKLMTCEHCMAARRSYNVNDYNCTLHASHIHSVSKTNGCFEFIQWTVPTMDEAKGKVKG